MVARLCGLALALGGWDAFSQYTSPAESGFQPTGNYCVVRDVIGNLCRCKTLPLTIGEMDARSQDSYLYFAILDSIIFGRSSVLGFQSQTSAPGRPALITLSVLRREQRPVG